MQANATFASAELPPLPAYTSQPVPDLFPSIMTDFTLSIVLPHIVYWIWSLLFHMVDTLDLFPQYRLHTPAEIAQRNRVGRWAVARDVLVEQAIQIASAAALSWADPPQMTGMEDYDVARWATRVRLAQRAVPRLLGLLGLNAAAISKNVAAGGHPQIAGALAGGRYPFLTVGGPGVAEGLAGPVSVPAFATWEIWVAKAIYWAVVPALQMSVAVWFLDTWQYFWHRAMHVNKWMYTHWHSRHHRLYVPYAYGALYNHPVEGFLLDTVGAGLAYKVSFLSPRLGMCFWAFSTLKTVDDHCGYALPWDPLQLISSNNSAYHDIHHQSWGIKHNFSQPYFTIWDRWMGTRYEADTKLRYTRDREAAEEKGRLEAKVEQSRKGGAHQAEGKKAQ